MNKITSFVIYLLSIVNYGDIRHPHYTIAKIILNHYQQIPQMTVKDIAKYTHSSSASITRFVKSAGFESFKDLKAQIGETLSTQSFYGQQQSLAKKSDLQPIFQAYSERIKDNIDYTCERLDYDQIDRICAQMCQCREMAVFGYEYETILGLYFQHQMAKINKFVRIGLTQQKQEEIINTIQYGSVVFVLSLEGDYFEQYRETMEHLKARECFIVAITMRDHQSLHELCQEVVLCNQYNADTEGHLTLLYIIEILIMYYCINYQMFSKA